MEPKENKRRMSTGKKFGLGCLGLIVLIIIISIASNSGKNDTRKVGDSPTASTTSTSNDNKIYKVGDSVQLGKAIVTVNKVESSTGSTYTKPASGNKWINLNITVENTDSSQQYLTTMGQMFVKDSDGNSFQVAVTDKVMESVNNSLDGTIIAKSKRTGWVGFEVKNESKGLQFQYNASMWGSGTITVDLGQ
ncbi:MAG: DUF4352 domain-containing protein [bacterium]|nr:DUF4352 domain-containing protein [bacterium]